MQSFTTYTCLSLVTLEDIMKSNLFNVNIDAANANNWRGSSVPLCIKLLIIW